MNQERQKELKEQLRIRCEECTGLCCVALYCMKTDGFPANKEAGVPCMHLMPDHRCDIHAELQERKMKGCLGYDCFGAGQKATKICENNGIWTTGEQQAKLVFEVYHIVFQLYQMMWYLLEAEAYVKESGLMEQLDELIEENIRMTDGTPEEICNLEIDCYRNRVNEVLKKVCGLHGTGNLDHSKNCFGKNFKKANLDQKDFSMALMIASNLEGCSLKNTIFLGADLRDANIRNTDLSSCRFLTQMQINSAQGNSKTKLPSGLTRPKTWRTI